MNKNGGGVRKGASFFVAMLKWPMRPDAESAAHAESRAARRLKMRHIAAERACLRQFAQSNGGLIKVCAAYVVSRFDFFLRRFSCAAADGIRRRPLQDLAIFRHCRGIPL